MQHLEGSDTPVLYIGRTVLKGWGSKNMVVFCKGLILYCEQQILFPFIRSACYTESVRL
jgi:hypothetical protein